jgi:hypothetical protein
VGSVLVELQAEMELLHRLPEIEAKLDEIHAAVTGRAPVKA